MERYDVKVQFVGNRGNWLVGGCVIAATGEEDAKKKAEEMCRDLSGGEILGVIKQKGGVE